MNNKSLLQFLTICLVCAVGALVLAAAAVYHLYAG